MEMSHVFLGLATGIPVMIVVGPVALLLIEQGMTKGVRAGAPAAFGVSAVDLVFASAAAMAGAAAASVLAPVEPLMRIAGIGVLGVLAWRLWRDAAADLARKGTPAESAQAEPPGARARVAGERGSVSMKGGDLPTEAALRGQLSMAGRFFVVTAVNPITIVVFTSIVLSGAEGVGTPGWVLGMVMASMSVSFLFLALGQGLGAVLSERATIRLRMAGAVLIVAMAGWFAFA